MVLGPIQGLLSMQFVLCSQLLSMQFVLCSQNKSILYIWVSRTLSAALPSPHLKALTEELKTETAIAAGTTKGKTLLKLLRTHLDALILPPTPTVEQRVTDSQPPDPQHEIMKFQRVTDSSAIMQGQDPTAKRNLVQTSRTHQ